MIPKSGALVFGQAERMEKGEAWLIALMNDAKLSVDHVEGMIEKLLEPIGGGLPSFVRWGHERMVPGSSCGRLQAGLCGVVFACAIFLKRRPSEEFVSVACARVEGVCL